MTSAKRSSAAADVPTLAEAMQTEYQAVVGYFLLAPAGTSKGIIDRLNSESLKALKSPELIARFEQDGAEAVPRSPEDTAAYIAAEIQRWGQAVKNIGVHAD